MAENVEYMNIISTSKIRAAGNVENVLPTKLQYSTPQSTYFDLITFISSFLKVVFKHY